MIEIAYFVVPVLGIIFLYALIKAWLDARAQASARHLELLEAALKNPSIDRATLESLTFQLTGARGPSSGAGGQRVMAIVLAFGWIGLFTGLGIWACGGMTDSSGLETGGIITSIASFGLVTYPFALRELQARRVQA